MILIVITVFFIILTFISWSDAKKGTIPNLAVLAIALLAFNREPQYYGFITSFTTALFLYVHGTLGAGDVKLAGATGLFTGIDGILILLISHLLVLIYAIFIYFRKGELKHWLKQNLFLLKLGPAAKNFIKETTPENSLKAPLGMMFLPATLIIFTVNYVVSGGICW